MVCGHDFKFHILGFQKFYPDAIQTSERAGAEVSPRLGFASSKHAVQFLKLLKTFLKQWNIGTGRLSGAFGVMLCDGKLYRR
ncbi:hypothetical protein AUP40_18995 [Thalassospira xiamenensis]|jgi:hypothetical protein|uniref:Uncharacterized protein n=1 Tax=Thalassospira xiamenensis TaxID=220697 RepID=A0ABR5Y1B4_9PROT|nr:hypothetical protein AUP40_18995 [Thalassospira xiamenensis]|tara:strand:+ start:4215 stop:4460 length:246 start_codon:yes stop_codon:yes gene_type:complete